MGSKFETRLLGELCHEITVGFVGSMTNEYIETGIPFLRSKNIDEYNVKWDDMKYVSSEFHKKLSKSALKPGDVAIVRTGKPGTTCVIPDSLHEANCSDIVIARVNNELLCPHYLSYFMNAMAHGQINAHVVGAVQQHFNVSSAKKIEIPLPSRFIQTEIVQVLKALDDKLRLNRQINQTLEQMAQALFKSWFVDFDPVVDNAQDAGFFDQNSDLPEELLRRAEQRKAVRQQPDFKPLPAETRQLFPAAFEECQESSSGLGGWVPKGWRMLQFGEFIHRSSVGKRYDQKSALPKGKIPILDQGKSGIIGFHNDGPGVRASLDSPVVVFANHTCYMRLITFDFSAIQNVLPFTGKGVDTIWAYFATQNRVKFSEYKGHWPDFVIEKASVPSLILTIKFREEVDSLIRRIRCNELQNQTLTNLRDTLLPKLISGELRLNDDGTLTDENTDC